MQPSCQQQQHVGPSITIPNYFCNAGRIGHSRTIECQNDTIQSNGWASNQQQDFLQTKEATTTAKQSNDKKRHESHLTNDNRCGARNNNTDTNLDCICHRLPDNHNHNNTNVNSTQQESPTTRNIQRFFLDTFPFDAEKDTATPGTTIILAALERQ